MTRTISQKTILYLLAVAFLGILPLSSCKREAEAAKLPDGISEYVYAFTSGVISKGSPIRVRFVNAVVGETEIGETAPSGLINFSPSIAGSASWEDAQTLRFDPADALESGRAYVAKVNLDKIVVNVPKGMRSFEFDFRTRDQYFELSVDGLYAPNPRELSKQELKGFIYTADAAEADAVAEILSATQSGKVLNVQWEHNAEQTTHTFYIKDIARGEAASSVQLSWNGKPLGVKLKEEKTIEVPSLNDFKIMEARRMQGSEQYIVLHFSDPLLESQNAEGLVTLGDGNIGARLLISGQQLRIYPSDRLVGTYKINVSPGLKNIANKAMKTASAWMITFEDAKPEIRLVGRGVVLPNSDGLIFPFEAIGLNAIEVEVFKIFNNNIMQFLQTNDLDGNGYDLYRVGRIVMRKKIALQKLNPGAQASDWTRYALDLSSMVQQDPNAFYQVRIGFRPAYSTYYCGDKATASINGDEMESATYMMSGEEAENESFMESWYGIDGYYENYNWSQREDPCYPAYYNSERFLRRNVIASNLGLIAKGGNDNSYFVAVADIRTAKPVANTELEFYDFQQQLLSTAKTDGEGMATVSLSRKPFVVIAKQGTERGYLKLEDGNSLSLSRFDVAGVETQKGLKGYLYGDRGVWRPGDSVYLNFVLEDRQSKLPANYPIQFELYDVRGQLQEKRSVARNVSNVYPLHFVTSPDAPTGAWQAKVKAGGATFEQTVRIETVKPNRLKIDLDFGKKELSRADEPQQAQINAAWLHGAPAAGLRAQVEVQLRSANTTFPKYDNFEFDDPSRSIETEPRTIFDGELNDNGQGRINTALSEDAMLPGKLTASFKTRVYERGGDFSTDQFSLPYHPFNVYAGVSLPKNKYGEKRIDIKKDGKLRFAALGKSGAPKSGEKLSVGLYRVEWRWWWDEGEDNISRYNTNQHFNAQQKTELRTNDKGEAEWTVNVQEWGRYLVRVCDTETGHCAGDFFYAGYPWYENNESVRDAAAMLAFSSDREKYNVGETVSLTIPTGEVGRALVTLENGTKVLQSFWVESKAGENKFTFKTTADMAPTVYAHVTLVQPHAQVKNDLPIRLYGVVPINVEDPDTRLSPKVAMPDVLRPEETITVEVSESKGRAMAYTVAIVDEGLLGLTRFKTPNPWDALYAREALGVKTWDLYDHVLGAYGAELERILGIGGDGELVRSGQDDRANRFKPVVIHLGPFQLEKGKKASHKIKIPNYVGSVRTMVVASTKGAYGSAEKTTPVRKPLMVLATLPRVLGPGEQVKLPVNVFAMEAKVKQATVTVKELNGFAKITSGSSQSVSFSKVGDKLLTFDVEMAQRMGVAKFLITAEGSGEKSTHEIEIQVRNPNPVATNVYSKVLANGESWNHSFEAPGMPGTNEGVLELSTIPPINLGERLEYLIQYPYGCLEQTLSGGFPQLYVGKLLEMNENMKKQVPINIKATIERLKQFQTSEGGFAYWPGQTNPNPWSSTYAGHFLLEAKALGYAIPASMLDKWLNYQKKTARAWDPKWKDFGYFSDNSFELDQAYRLYTLALAQKSEMGAMNRLREMKSLNNATKWRLAAAYAVAGKKEVAQELTKNIGTEVKDYRELSYSYGSGLRDRAMILETLVLLGNKTAAAEVVKYISDQMSAQRWFSTQETSYALLAVGKFVGVNGTSDKLQFSYQLNGAQAVNAGANSPMMQIDVPMSSGNGKKVMVKNTSKSVLFAKLIVRGQPAAGQEEARSSDLLVSVTYKDMKGKVISPNNLAQGVDFVAEVRVKHPATRPMPYKELALAQIFPSGWEIINSRMDGMQGFNEGSRPEYRDYRDDRVNTFFHLSEGEEHIYRVQLNAAYQGKYYLPSVSCEAMYDNSINARTSGMWVEVSAPKNI